MNELDYLAEVIDDDFVVGGPVIAERTWLAPTPICGDPDWGDAVEAAKTRRRRATVLMPQVRA